jgi:hypothetical protein
MTERFELWADIVDEYEKQYSGGIKDFSIQYWAVYRRKANPITLFVRKIVDEFDIEFDNVMLLFKDGRVKELTFSYIDDFYFHTTTTIAFKDYLTPYIKSVNGSAFSNSPIFSSTSSHSSPYLLQ